MPVERVELFSQFVVEIKEQDSDERIIEICQWWMEHDKEREDRAAIGRKIVMEQFLMKHFIDRSVAGA